MRYYECGICGEWHREGFHGDCRNDDERLTLDQVWDEAGQDFEEVAMEDAK